MPSGQKGIDAVERLERERATAATHSPGPWKIEKYSDLSVRDGERIRSADGLIIVPEVWGNSLSACDANYRLIAAAPDLLDQLKIAYRSLSQYKVGDELCGIRAAIAKAEARP